MDLRSWFNSGYNRLRLVLAMLLACIGIALYFDLGETLRGLPHLAVYSITIVWVILAVKLGYRLGWLKYVGVETKPDSTVTAVTGALMGLLAFMLAFTFSLSMSRYDTRKNLYIEQVNAIENCYRRANLLPDRYKDTIQAELIKYIDLRIAAIGHAEKIQGWVTGTDPIHHKLWGILIEMQRDSAITPPLQALTTTALTSLIEAHNKRISVGIIYHLPTPMWVALYLLVAAAMAGMGYLFGLSSRMNWTLVLLLSFSFSLVMILISDLDRSGTTHSFIEFNKQAMIDLKARMLKL